VKKQGLKGAAIGGMVAGVEFSDPKFHPVWAKAEELGVPLFIHPQGVGELSKRLSGNGWLGNTIGNPLETTIALSHLIFEGTLDRFPGLKVIAAHGGGFLPSYADRSDHACMVGPAGCNADIKLKKKPSEYLKQLYFDSLIFSPEAIRHLAAQVGSTTRRSRCWAARQRSCSILRRNSPLLPSVFAGQTPSTPGSHYDAGKMGRVTAPFHRRCPVIRGGGVMSHKKQRGHDS